MNNLFKSNSRFAALADETVNNDKQKNNKKDDKNKKKDDEKSNQ